MASITLQHRQSLARRIPMLGVMRSRHINNYIRFGDVASDRAALENAMAIQDGGQNLGPAGSQHYVDNTDWLALFNSDPAWTRMAYERIARGLLDPFWMPTLDDWFRIKGITPGGPTSPIVSPAPDIPPVHVPYPPPVSTPGMTEADYQKALVEMQLEAARLQALATARQAEAARQAAEAATRNVEVPLTEAKADKSPFPLALAALAAYLVLKG